MNATLPPKQGPGLIDPNDGTVTVGVVVIPGVGPRIGLAGVGAFLHFSPAGARRMAHKWETPEAHAVNLEWVAEALREAADEVEALTATRQ